MKLWSSKACESGVFVPFLAIVLATVLLCIGLLIDVGNLLYQKRVLQDAVDASAVTAAHRVEFETPGNLDTHVIRKVVNDNLTLAGIDPANASLVINFSPLPNPDSVAIDARLRVNTLLLHLLGAAADFNFVTAQATADVVSIYIELALDSSGSMCSNQCVTPGTSPCDDANCPKVAGLKAGVAAFVDSLRDEDHLGIVRFSASQAMNNAVVVTPVQLMTPGNRSSAKTAVQALNAIQNTPTNMFSALSLAMNEINAAAPPPKAVKVIILFTDGAPWTGGTSGPPASSGGCPGFVANDSRYGYLNAITAADAARAQGFIVFVVGLGIPHDYQDLAPPAWTPMWNKIPQTVPTPAVPGSYPCNIPLYADPFQGPWTGTGTCQAEGHLKEFLLARIANDRNFMLSNEIQNTVPAPTPVPSPQPDFPCVPGKDAIAATPNGQLFVTPDPNDLDDIFVLIGGSLIKLVE